MTIRYDNLAKTKVCAGNLMAKFREANVIDIGEVLAEVLESTGDVSVLYESGNNKLTINYSKK